MKWFNLILVLIVFGCSSHSDISSETIEVNRKKVYKGFINNKYPITMELTYSRSGDIKGRYYYDNVGEVLMLRGTSNEIGEIDLLEYDSEGNKTGEFKGMLSDGGDFEGEWNNHKKLFEFKVLQNNKDFDELDRKRIALENNINALCGEYFQGDFNVLVEKRSSKSLFIDMCWVSQNRVHGCFEGEVKLITGKTNVFEGALLDVYNKDKHKFTFIFEGDKVVVSSSTWKNVSSSGLGKYVKK